jgi:inhibitor of cysteine peptidase
MAEIVAREKNNGDTLAARVGDTLTIEVPENPTTGFRWAPVGVDSNMVDLQTDDFRPEVSAAVGGGGVRLFRFLVKAPGLVRLQLKLVRTWESGAASKTFDVTLDVRA